MPFGEDTDVRNVPARRIVAMVVVVLLALAVYQIGRWLADKGIDQADKIGSLTSALIAVLGLLFPLLRRGLGWARGHMPIIDIDVARVRDELATALDGQWAEEERLRRVYNPRPLPVRWEETDIAGATMPGVVGPATGGKVPAYGGGFDDVLAMFSGLRRVVVLGPAGAGKSVLITKLARDLIAARRRVTLSR